MEYGEGMWSMTHLSRPLNRILTLLLLALSVWAGSAQAEPYRRNLDDLEEFDDTIAYHSYPNAGYQTENEYTPQYVLTQFHCNEGFYLQGIKALVLEGNQQISSLTFHVYEDSGDNTPGDFLFTYNDDVVRIVEIDNLVWAEVPMSAPYWWVFQEDAIFWISVEVPSYNDWTVVQDDNGLAGISWIGDGMNGGPNHSVSSGDWILAAGGSTSWQNVDLRASQLWNTSGKYHLQAGSTIEFSVEVENLNDTPAPGGTCSLAVENTFGQQVFSTTRPFDPLPGHGVHELVFDESWSALAGGQYMASVTVLVDGDIDFSNNSTMLYQQIISTGDYYSFDDETVEDIYDMPPGQNLGVLMIPAQHPAKSAEVRIWFDQAYPTVRLKAYTFQSFTFSQFWEYAGPVDSGWMRFALASPPLSTGSIVVVLENESGLRVPVDTAEPQIIPNDRMPFSYFLTDGSTWTPDPDLPGKPLVQILYEHPSADDLLQLELVPDETQPYIEPGESFGYSGTIFNSLQTIYTIDVWTEMTWPNGDHFEPLQLQNNVTLVPNTPFELPHADQLIPASAPEGLYMFRMNVGDYPTVTATFNAFNVNARTEVSVDETTTRHAEQSSAFTVSEPSPNPFNPLTSLRINLREMSQLQVTLFDVLGRQVQTLADGHYAPGELVVTVDGRDLASGVYFVTVLANDHAPVLRKLTLIK
ncbi:T9SS type A sorting domain-containing protein [bacterium]|nr:T9SS type A sorting domain-containing protein [bacterium]